jgi:hypothetical protein
MIRWLSVVDGLIGILNHWLDDKRLFRREFSFEFFSGYPRTVLRPKNLNVEKNYLPFKFDPNYENVFMLQQSKNWFVEIWFLTLLQVAEIYVNISWWSLATTPLYCNKLVGTENDFMMCLPEIWFSYVSDVDSAVYVIA